MSAEMSSAIKNIDSGSGKTIGGVFSRQYLQSDIKLKDDPYFRNRISAYAEKHFSAYFSEISHYLLIEAGYEVRSSGYTAKVYHLPQFFKESPIEVVLSTITLIWRFFNFRIKFQYGSDNTKKLIKNPMCDPWKVFVARAFRENNLGYSLDEECGVHLFIDEDFEQSRNSTLLSLNQDKFSAVRDAFEKAHQFLDSDPPDTKSSIRSAFESLEIMTKLLVKTNNLNAFIVKNNLKNLIVSQISDVTEKEIISGIFEGLSNTVNALHLARHGQKVENPIEISSSTCVYALSLVAANLRLLSEFKAQEQN